MADRVLSTNESFREVAVWRGGKAPDRVHVVMNGPDLAAFPEPRWPPAGAGDPPCLVGYIGHIDTQYGIDELLLAAAHLVHGRGRDDLRFRVVGGGPLRAEKEALARELGLERHVEFTGALPQPEAIRLLSECRIGVVPAPATTASDRMTHVKTLEYMALGIPVVQYDRTEGRRAAADAALYARPGDVHDFADRIGWLADHPEEARSMGRRGRRRVEERYAWAHQAERLRMAYRVVRSELEPR